MSNRSFSALVLSAATASANGADIDNSSGWAAIFTVDITTITGTTPTATFTVQGKDELSGKYYTILATTALNATGTTVLKVGAGLTASANLVANDLLPRTFRVICTTGGTVTNLTATVGCCLVS